MMALLLIHPLQSESPSRKRRKTSGSYIDLTDSPSPPPSQIREATLEAGRVNLGRRRSQNQRRISSEQRCNTPRARRRLV